MGSSSLNHSESSSYRLPSNDDTSFAKEHDSFLDSLLHEQQQLLLENNHDDDDANCSMSTQSNHSWTLSPASFAGSQSTDSSSRKRRRMRRKSSPLRPRTSIDKENTKPPMQFLHPNCRMQKDKGKGDQPLGSNVCAKTAEACVSKLRVKMQLLTEHCNTATASMKRRPATVSRVTAKYCETRSLLTLRMGFLSMTYGVLLRWDTARTRKVTLVVLRKNCHESFYKRVAPSWLSFPEESLTSQLAEVRVTVLYASGFRSARWTAKMTLGDETENILMVPDGDVLVPKLNSCVTGTGTELVIRLYEHQRHTRTLRSTMRVPTGSLQEEPTNMRIPCPEGGFLQLEAVVHPWRPAPTVVAPIIEEPIVQNPWDWILCC